jgi:uncharacterized damage-inducible protein DinB
MNYTLSRPPTAGAGRRVEQRNVRRRTLRPLIQLLRQFGEVVDRLGDGQYVQKPVGVIESSVGGHVRHCLDHVRALLRAVETGRLNYDRRERGTLVESSRACAAEQIEAAVSDLAWPPSGALARPLTVSVTMSSGDEPIEMESSVGRELAFVLSHTIHHNAIVNAMVRTLGGWLPERFGYAPSTVRYLERTAAACAR